MWKKKSIEKLEEKLKVTKTPFAKKAIQKAIDKRTKDLNNGEN